MNNKVMLILSMCIFAMLISSCDIFMKNDSLENSSYFSNSEFSCLELNCWYSIIPGETERNEVISILEQLFTDENIIVNDHIIEWSSGWVTFSEEDIVSQVNIITSEDELTLGDLNNHVGEPTEVMVTFARSAELECFESFLVYPQAGIIALVVPEDELIGANENHSIYSRTYLPMSEFDDINVPGASILEWTGFKDYCQEAVANF